MLNHLFGLTQVVFCLLLLLVPVSIGSLNPTAEIAAVLAVLVGLLMLPFLIIRKPSINSIAIEIIVLFVVYFAIGLISIFTAGVNDTTLDAIGTTSHFLLFGLLFYVLLKIDMQENWFWWACVIGACGNGVYSLFVEPRGSINPILYGGISACLAFLSLISWKRLSSIPVLNLFSLLGFMLGLVAVFSSMSRGSWLTLPGFLIVLMVYLLTVSQRKVLIFKTMISVIIGVGVIGWYAQDEIRSRVKSATTDLVQYYSGERYKTSVGYRLEQYKGSLEIIKLNPILGVGLGKEMTAMNELSEQGIVRPMPIIKNVHNQVLQEGVAKGLLGIVSYFILMGYLLKVFVIGMRRSIQFKEIHTAGAMLIIGYFIIGLTNITFTHGVLNTFFVSMVALILGVNGLLDDYKRIMSSSSK